MCTDPGVEMGIARRSDRVPVYYLYHLHRNDPQLHAFNCPHRIEHDSGAPLSPTDPNDQHPFLPDPGSLVVHVPVLQPQPIKPNAPAFHLTGLDALLDTLLVSSGLNVWRPYFAGHRSYFQARYRIIEASKKIRTFGASTLADSLYFPPVWDPAKSEDIEFELDDFLSRLLPTEDQMLPRGVIIGRVRDLELKPTWTAPRIKLAETRLQLWLDPCPDLIGPPSPDFSYLVMLAVERPPGTAKLRVLEAASSLVTPSWIPVATPDHAALANQLVDSRVAFTSPMRSDETTSWAYPDILANAAGSTPRRIPLPFPIDHSKAHRSSQTHQAITSF